MKNLNYSHKSFEIVIHSGEQQWSFEWFLISVKQAMLIDETSLVSDLNEFK